MQLTWELLAIGAMTLVNFFGGLFLKRLISQIDKMDQTIQQLTSCVAKQSERWANHEKHHSEIREDRKSNERDLWNAIHGLRAKV